ncbi:hypothetical protein D3C80_1784170 [compost metagenome]
MAAATATTGQVSPPITVIMALPTVPRIVQSMLAAATIRLIPLITGPATRPNTPSAPIISSAPLATLPSVVARALLFTIHLSSFST